jgi:hypothetical protein
MVLALAVVRPVRGSARKATSRILVIPSRAHWLAKEGGSRNPHFSRALRCVLYSCHMSHTLTIRLTDELRDWLKERSRRTGIPVGRLIREQLETAKAKGGKQRFLRHAGAITGGPPDVSSRKGFSRS